MTMRPLLLCAQGYELWAHAMDSMLEELMK